VEHETDRERSESAGQPQQKDGHEQKMYLRFCAMIATAVVVMFGLTYLNTYEFSHVRWSETRVYMALLMGGAMAIIMLAFMIGMYKNRALNAGIVVGGLVLIALGTLLVRSQTTVQDRSYMRAMIPHHSIAILTSERSEISDVRVCELAVGIIKAQRREIKEMGWLIDDIDENGPATSMSAGEQRPVPVFQGTSIRSCSQDN
jgi:cytochrome c oxidase subunit IV